MIPPMARFEKTLFMFDGSCDRKVDSVDSALLSYYVRKPDHSTDRLTYFTYLNAILLSFEIKGFSNILMLKESVCYCTFLH